MGQAFSRLPPSERARRYRDVAAVSLDQALKQSTQEMTAAYLDLSADWLALARGLESEFGGVVSAGKLAQRQRGSSHH